jgi:hypothetical protein
VTIPLPRTAALAVTALALLASHTFIGPADEKHADEKRDVVSYTVAEKVATLSVRSQAGRVEVLPGTGPVAVREEYTYTSTRPDATHTLVGRALNLVDSGCAAQRCTVDYRIEVPAGTAVTVNADAGAVSVTGITAAVRIAADAGAVTLTNVTGEIDVTATAGAVTGRGLRDTTTVESDGGPVDLTFAAPALSVDVTTDAGNITLRLPSGSYAVETMTFGGRLVVDVPTDPSSLYHVTARAGTGAVEVLSSP